MKKRFIGLLAVVLLVLSIFVLAQENQPSGEAEECGFWCKLNEMLWGTGEGEKALVGKAGGVWGGEGREALVGKAGGIWGKAGGKGGGR